MAKTSDVNFIEQHIEKIILGLAVVFLLFAVFKWGISTPVEVDIQSRQVPPSEIDQKLQDVSEDIKQRAQRVALPPLGEVPDFSSIVEGLRNEPIEKSIMVTRMGSPRPPIVRAGERGGVEPGEGVLLSDLVQSMPAPAKIKVAGVRELLDKVEDPDTLAAHVIADYPVAELLKNWREKLQATSIGGDLTAIVAKVEVQRREIRPDGTMSDPVVVSQTVYSGYQDVPVEIVEIPQYTGGETRELVRDAVAQLASPLMQEDVLRPLYWPVWAAEQKKWVTWKYKMPWTEKEAPAVTPAGAESSGERQRELERRRREYMERRRTEAEARRARRAPAAGARTPGVPGAPGGMMGPGMDPRMMGPGMPTGRTPARTNGRATGRTAARTTSRTTARRIATPPAMDPGMMGGPGAARLGRNGRAGAALGKREVAEEAFDTETIHLWFHDGDVKVQKRYVYRVRLFFVNPLLTYEKETSKKSPQDATIRFVETPWSPWSKPILIPRSTEFFVTSAMEPKDEFTCTIFAQSLGQWVKEKFKVQAGNPIGGIVRKTVTNPATGEQTQQDVNFSTDAIVVEMDFKKRIITPAGITKKTFELIYLDGGNLMSQLRITDLDRKDPLRKKYDEFLKKVRRAEAAAGNVDRTPRPARGPAPPAEFPF